MEHLYKLKSCEFIFSGYPHFPPCPGAHLEIWIRSEWGLNLGTAADQSVSWGTKAKLGPNW